jgi:hypothetical protein
MSVHMEARICTVARNKTPTPEATTQSAPPPVTFTLEAVKKIVAESLAKQRAEFLQAMAEQQQAAKPGKMAIAGKTERAIANEIAAVRAFHRAGFKDAKPHVNILTFNKWAEKGYRPIEGSKSLKVKNLRLFHISQVRKLTADEVKANNAQSADAVARHDKAAKSDKVIPIGGEANPQ